MQALHRASNAMRGGGVPVIDEDAAGFFVPYIVPCDAGETFRAPRLDPCVGLLRDVIADRVEYRYQIWNRVKVALHCEDTGGELIGIAYVPEMTDKWLAPVMLTTKAW